MLSKAARPYDPQQLPEAKRLRQNIVDLYSSNVISAKRAQELLNDAAAAGDRFSARVRGRMTKNTARNLRRRLLKGNLWPPVYNARIRVWNTKAKQEEVQQLSFLLPHEVLAVIKSIGQDELLYGQNFI